MLLSRSQRRESATGDRRRRRRRHQRRPLRIPRAGAIRPRPAQGGHSQLDRNAGDAARRSAR